MYIYMYVKFTGNPPQVDGVNPHHLQTGIPVPMYYV